MEVITAITARQLANDFENNPILGPALQKTMSEIMYGAIRGKTSVNMYIPTNWDKHLREMAVMFFMALGYKIVEHPSAIDICW